MFDGIDKFLILYDEHFDMLEKGNLPLILPSKL